MPKRNEPYYIVMHHSATPDHPQRNDRDIFKVFHTSHVIDGVMVTKEEYDRRKASGEEGWFREPWDDIGYHYVIEENEVNIPIIGFPGHAGGITAKVALVVNLGRDVHTAGVHSKGTLPDRTGFERPVNEISIGVVIAGNFDVSPVPQDTWDFAAAYVAKWCEEWDIPVLNILAHNTLQPEKTCPGTNFNMEAFRVTVEGHLFTAEETDTIEGGEIPMSDYDLNVILKRIEELVINDENRENIADIIKVESLTEFFGDIPKIIDLFEDVTKAVEYLWREVDEIPKEDRLDVAAKFLDDLFKFPFYIEPIDKPIFKAILSVVVGQLNKKFGKDWPVADFFGTTG